MKFEAAAHHENAHYSLNTFDFKTLMDFLTEHEDVYCEVVDGSTGEIIYYSNCPDTDRPDYANEDFELMALGWMYKGWLENQAKAKVNEDLVGLIQEVCRIFSIDPQKVK